MKRILPIARAMQSSIAGIPSAFALDTLPSFSMTNLTTTLPSSSGSFFSAAS